MTKNILKAMAVLFSAIILAACSSDDNGTPAQVDYPTPVPEVLPDDAPHWYRVQSIQSYNIDQYINLLAKDAIPSNATAVAVPMLKIYAASMPQDMKIVVYNFDYKSSDGITDNAILSGQVIVPLSKGKLISNLMVLDNRFTQLADADVPTHKLNVGAVLALVKGTPVVTCDMLGYGSSSDHTLNYHCRHMGAKNTVDAAIAAQQMLHSKKMNLGLTGKALRVYNEGYSQGGYGALSVLRYIQQEATAEEKSLMPIIKTSCGAGAYDTGLMVEKVLSQEQYGYYPFIIAALITAIDYHPDIYPQLLTVNSLLTKEMQDFGLMDKVRSKKYSSTEIIEMMQKELQGDLSPKRVFCEDFLNPEGELHKLIIGSAAMESLITDWQPLTPLHFFHASNDDVVPKECAEAAMAAFNGLDNVTSDIKEITTIFGMNIPGFTDSTSPHVLGYFEFVMNTVMKDLDRYK